MTNRDDIKGWLYQGKEDGKKYMSVYCDTYDYTNFPVYAVDIKEFWREYDDPHHQESHMARLMEVYDYSLDLEMQLCEYKTMHMPDRIKEIDKSKRKPHSIHLEELDLTKHGGFGGGSKRSDLENTSNHPDFNDKDNFLIKHHGRYYAGKFNKIWFGWSFFVGSHSLQYDKPGTNMSGWEKIWKIVED